MSDIWAQPLHVYRLYILTLITFSNMTCKLTVSSLFSSFFLFRTTGWVEKETYYWSMEHLCSLPLHLPLISHPPSLHPWQDTLQMPRPLKDKKRFEAIFITTAPKIKNSKSTLTTFYIDPPSFPHLLWYSLHVFSHCCVHKPIYLPNGSCILCM